MKRHQALPGAGAQREALRAKGQFWTPSWVAEAMAAYVLQGGAGEVFDPAVGAGAFFQAVKEVKAGRDVALCGCEIDPDALGQARETRLTAADLAGVESRDFALDPPPGPYAAILANPPYLRHHRLSAAAKESLKAFGGQLLGRPLDGRAGLHVYFFLRALTLLAPEGRLAFLLPADVCEGVFANALWRWITGRFRLDAVVTFAPEATPFPGVDTNALVFLLQNAPPTEQFAAVHCHASWHADLRRWIETKEVGPSLSVCRRRVSEALSTGLSRPPADENAPVGPVLGDFARVQRGVATGDNAFFFLTDAQTRQRNLSPEFLLRAVGRTRDVEADVVTEAHLNALDTAGRPTWLFSPDGRPLEAFPPAVQEYLRQGKAQGLPERALIRTRTPWYKMERREPPPFLFAYLGRRSARFIRNEARAVPLTGFLCVYPRRTDAHFLHGLWEVLRHPETVAALPRVGKSYGSGAIKVEPRALERLPLPPAVVAAAGLFVPKLILERSAAYV